MASYQMRVRDETGQVTRVVDLERDDDGAAIAEMASHDWAPTDGGLELWNGGRCVMVGYLSSEAAESLAAAG